MRQIIRKTKKDYYDIAEHNIERMFDINANDLKFGYVYFSEVPEYKGSWIRVYHNTKRYLDVEFNININ